MHTVDRSRSGSFRQLLRRIATGFGVLLFLLIIAAGGVLLALHHRMQTSLAPVDGTLHLPGLGAPVTVRRDAHDVPHLEAANMSDLLEAQGWVTASDRLWQMDMARRLPAGEAAEVLGSALLPHDRMERTLGMRDVAQRMVATLPPGQLVQLEAYARGVNAYIAHAEQAGGLPAEFLLLLYKPAPWRPLDSMLIALSMSEMLDERWQAKLKREQVTARLAAHGEAALATDLFPTGSWRDHPPVPSVPAIGEPQDVPQVPLDSTQTRMQPPQTQTPVLPVENLLTLAGMGEGEPCAGCRPGSNEWAVSGAHTASGKPLLSNDMHLDHGIPDLWYESELRARAFHVAGVTIPGLPMIAVGHNDHIAWGFTALGGDTQDVYIEQVNAQGQYRSLNFSGNSAGNPAENRSGSEQWLPLSHQHEVIHVRGGGDVPLDVERTAHGPLITGLIPGEHRALALHWTIYDAQAKGLPLFALDSAVDWTSFRAAMATWWAPTLNAAYADDAGHIGYQAIGLIPVRAGGLQGVPVTLGTVAAIPGSPGGIVGPGDPGAAAFPVSPAFSSAANPARQLAAQNAAPQTPGAPAAQAPAGEWTGTIPFEALPSVLDPQGGIVATANARISPDGYPYQLTLEWASPYRNERIWRWLAAKRGLMPADMLRLQTDVYSEVDREIAQRFAYAIDHAAHPGERERAAADLLRSWDGVLDVNSPAAAIMTATEQLFWPAVLGAKIGDGWRLYDWTESTYAREQLIVHQPAAWLPGGYGNWNDFLASLVETACKPAPNHLADWRYGSTHTIAMEHPLWKRLPGFHAGIGPLPQSGNQSTVKQVSGTLGPSQRFTADFGDLDQSTENIVMGEAGDPASPYARDQWASWYGGTTFTLPFSPGAVQAAARHTLRLLP